MLRVDRKQQNSVKQLSFKKNKGKKKKETFSSHIPSYPKEGKFQNWLTWWVNTVVIGSFHLLSGLALLALLALSSVLLTSWLENECSDCRHPTICFSLCLFLRAGESFLEAESPS